MLESGPTMHRDLHLFARLMRLAACLLLLASVSVSSNGRVGGCRLAADPQSGRVGVECGGGPFSVDIRSGEPAPRVQVARRAAAGLVLLAAAFVPLFTRSRGYRIVQLVLDVAVLGFWNVIFLSSSRLVGWVGSGIHAAPLDFAVALLLLAMAFAWPLFGRNSHYCLWACPFGAAQELAGRLGPGTARLSRAAESRLATFRRALWAALMLAAVCAGWSSWMEWELFAAFAWKVAPPLMLALSCAFVALSAFVHRPYCRFVCPTGTLLKLSEANNPETRQTTK